MNTSATEHRVSPLTAEERSELRAIYRRQRIQQALCAVIAVGLIAWWASTLQGQAGATLPENALVDGAALLALGLIVRFIWLIQRAAQRTGADLAKYVAREGLVTLERCETDDDIVHFSIGAEDFARTLDWVRAKPERVAVYESPMPVEVHTRYAPTSRTLFDIRLTTPAR